MRSAYASYFSRLVDDLGKLRFSIERVGDEDRFGTDTCRASFDDMMSRVCPSLPPGP